MKFINVAFYLLFAVFTATASETVYAVIQNGVVTNTVVADQSFIDQHFSGAPRVDNVTPPPGIGWGYDGTTWTAPQVFAIVTGSVVTQVVTGLPAKISVQYPGAIRIDNVTPRPDLNWSYDGTIWSAPQTFSIVNGGVVTRVVSGPPTTVLAQYPGAIRIDNLTPVPGLGWSYDGTTFTATSK